MSTIINLQQYLWVKFLKIILLNITLLVNNDNGNISMRFIKIFKIKYNTILTSTITKIRSSLFTYICTTPLKIYLDSFISAGTDFHLFFYHYILKKKTTE